ncbi:MAG: hypothetical protein LBS81_03750 [Endomicrobium sp.]|nr:hypothetical protein [Endomicrobium sp.]
MKDVKFYSVKTVPPDFKNMFEIESVQEEGNYIQTLLSKLMNSGSADAVIIASAVKILDLNKKDLQEIINTVAASGNSARMFIRLRYRLITKVYEKILERLKNNENPDAVLNWALPTSSVMVLRNMSGLGIIDAESIRNIVASLPAQADLFSEIMYQKKL